MRIPWLLHLATAATLVPLLVGLRSVALSPAQRWTLARCGFVFSMNALSLILALSSLNNLWMIYVVTPIATGMALWVLAYWQGTAVAARWVRLLIPVLAGSWVVIVLGMENLDNFSLLAEPFAGLLVLGAASYTLIGNTIRETRPLGQAEWFWIGLGLALSSVGSIALPPTVRWLVASHPELVVRAYEVKAALEVVAFLAIARGIACRAPPQRGRAL